MGRADILDLLRCLTEADARAAGPAAWSPWRAQLINSLADHTEGLLVDEEPGWTSASWWTSVWLDRFSSTGGRGSGWNPSLEAYSSSLRRRPARSFSDTAGLLASHSVQVRSAVLHTVEGVAVNTWRVDKQVPTCPTPRTWSNS